MARLTIGLLLAIGALAALPAVSASASTSVEAVWSDQSDYVQVLCSLPGTYTEGSHALQVYNPCSDRVWLHYYDNANGQVYAYCVNPGRAIAYDFPYPFTDLQLTNNPSQCDVDRDIRITWLNPDYFPSNQDYGCIMGYPPIILGGNSISALRNYCNFRVWIHVSDSGTGAGYCIDPNPNNILDFGYTPSNDREYWEATMTYNQAPCDAGGPPYPY